MKKVFWIIIAISIIGLIYLNMDALKEPVSTKLLFQQTFYTGMSDDSIVVYGYTNLKNRYTMEDAIDHITVENDTKTTSMLMESFNVSYGNSVSYLGDQYLEVIYTLNLPTLAGDFYIQNAFMQITLKNDESESFDIGKISLFKAEPGLDILNLYGTSKASGYQIDTVFMTLDASNPIFIESICYGLHECISIHQVTNEYHELEIPFMVQDYVLTQAPFKIYYLLNSVEYEATISTFRFFEIRMTILNESELNRIYVID